MPADRSSGLGAIGLVGPSCDPGVPGAQREGSDGREYGGLPPGKYRWVTTVSAITFVMIFCLMLFGTMIWLVRDTLNQAVRREEAADAREKEFSTIVLSLQASTNSNNHNLAGMTNVVNTLIQEVQSLRTEVKSLNRVASRISIDAPKAAGKPDGP